MASFRTHISWGIACGVLGVFLLVISMLVPQSWSLFVLLWLMVTIGAILPDMDSDSGIPFHVTFGALSIIAGGLAFLVAYKYVPQNPLRIAEWTIGSAIFMWGIVGTLFRRFTKHRGMAHSIPSAVLVGLCVFSLASYWRFDEWQSFLLGVAMTFGYIVHLVLDEVYAAVNFHGVPFVPNKALGSALKFYSKSWRINMLVYGSITLLIVRSNGEIFRLGKHLVNALH
ncbi:MAG: metal-dependent hydrolase [Candidatus Moraniibacteriota bacterium]|nr:MAG: metal-dependent hydrolase [Candidatus Moranbacteria bacterium]